MIDLVPRPHMAMQTDESRKVSQYFINLNSNRRHLQGAGCCSSRSQAEPITPHYGSPITLDEARNMVTNLVVGVPIDTRTMDAIDLWDRAIFSHRYLGNDNRRVSNQDAYNHYRHAWIQDYLQNPHRHRHVNEYTRRLEHDLRNGIRNI
jgi:hypothetical protein